ncbi:glycoside hydrolase family 15 protein [Poriferisphaera sp. WC338]|uniref:glycoside hydrolase family 15 protein n=1 Tax=Poriferisphaera sp. WC338 TaxID=3425129 RepID=UPI003D81B8CA
MPRDIPVGNGQMLVAFDEHYQIRDLYYPHVGQENHAGGAISRFGVWADLPTAKSKGDRRQKRLFWTDEDWHIKSEYQPDTLATNVNMTHNDLKLTLSCSDVVDFHRPLLVRRIEITNNTDKLRDVRLISHHDFHMYGTKVGDTAFFDPELRSLIHYRKQRYIMTCFYMDGEQQIDEFATGTAGFGGAEGTWRDAEDGKLECNPIAQGAVDSTMLCRCSIEPHGKRVAYLVVGCGMKHEDMQELHKFIHREGPQGIIDRTTAYWRLWLAACRTDFSTTQPTGISNNVEELFKRSLLVVRTQIDNGGAIIAANDTDIMQFARDTYSYLWPRDGAFVADAIDSAGFPDVARNFFKLCADIITDDGFFLHKYCPDGSTASSWHPWLDGHGRPQLPIQEDETALVIWALWRHYVRYRDIEFVRPMWMKLIKPAADFLVKYRDPITKLPLPSYDLWEERWGIHAFTVATVYAGLRAAWQFAVCFGDSERASSYARAAEEVQDAFCQYMWSDKHDRFLRRIEPVDSERISELINDIRTGKITDDSEKELLRALPGEKQINGSNHKIEVQHHEDEVLDASMYAIFSLGLLHVDDERVRKTMDAIENELWIKTDVGGVARYTDDYYHQVSQDTDKVPGNPWFICTLWLAEYYIAKAKSPEELKSALPILEWTADHALPSGVLAEQVHPETNAPLSVSPLTWSHATVVSTVVRYINRYEEMTVCPTCGQDRQCHLPSEQHKPAKQL